MAYQRAIVALDVVSEAAETVLARAKMVCGDAEVTALHVVDETFFGPTGGPEGARYAYRPIEAVADLRGRIVDECTERLAALASKAGFADHVVRSGHAAAEIHRCAEERGAGIVVLGAHGRRGWRLLLGSTANAVLHGATCDVLCVHIPEEVRPFQQVLVAVDGTEEADRVVEQAVAMAAPSGAKVSLLSVVKPLEQVYAGMDLAVWEGTGPRFVDEVEATMQSRLAELAQTSGATGERMLRRGNPAHEIHAVAEELAADLVVVGTHGRHGFSLLLGSTANAVLHGAKTDVLAVRLGQAGHP